MAFVGGAAAELAIDASRSFGFAGDMWAVNPRRELRGLPTLASVDDLPAPPDAAFVGVDCHATVDVVRRLADLGTGAAVCHASGFAETGEAGAALQAELVAAAEGMPLVGPNCYGTLSAVTGAALWPDVHGLTRTGRGVALLSQSGNIAVNLTMQRRGLDVAHVMALGNQADLGIAEAFEAMVADHAVTGVGLVVEAVDDVGRLAAAARVARQRSLPVVALKLGASDASGAIALTHTASLVGDAAAYDALFRRAGIYRVHTVPELLDTLAVLCAVGPLKGNRLVSLSCSGGEAALVADRAQGLDLTLPDFAPDHRCRVEAALDDRVAVTNPLDYHTFIWGDRPRLEECFGAVLGAGSSTAVPATAFDVALLVLDLPAEQVDRTRWWPTLEAFGGACATAAMPGVVAASMAENLPEEARVRAARIGLACCGDIDTALSAISAAAALGRRPVHPAGCSSELLPPAHSARSRPRRPSAVLSEHEAKRRLEAVGIVVPAGLPVPAQEAAAAAERHGCPVVVKAVGVAHKTEVGGVVVGLEDPSEIDAAARRLAGGDGVVMLESCVTGAVAELLVSVRSSPPVGMLLTVGAGGTLAELLDDTASLLLPASRDDVREALCGLRIWPMLAGHRGRPAGAVEAVVDAVDALGVLVRDDRSIIEVEINPLMVTSHAAVAADALMLVAEHRAHA